MNLPRLTKKIWIIIITAGVVVLTLVPSLYFYNQYREAQRRLQNPGEFAKDEVRLLKEKIGTLIELPSGEEPTVATVSDVEKLKSQSFFVHAQNGDKVLIYTADKKAILYRPSTNKIIDVAPVNVGAEKTAVTTPTIAPTKSAPTKETN
jgi:hypothetical protein